VTFGIGGLVGNVAGGLGYETLGMTWLYLASAGVSALGTVLYWAGTRSAGRGTREIG